MTAADITRVLVEGHALGLYRLGLTDAEVVANAAAILRRAAA